MGKRAERVYTDRASIRQTRFPVFAAGVTHRGPYKEAPGEINVPVAIDGMVVEPGDLLLGDDDGVVCVPKAAAEAVYAASKAKHESEEQMLAAIRAGTSDRAWVDERLKELGYVATA